MVHLAQDTFMKWCIHNSTRILSRQNTNKTLISTLENDLIFYARKGLEVY